MIGITELVCVSAVSFPRLACLPLRSNMERRRRASGTGLHNLLQARGGQADGDDLLMGLVYSVSYQTALICNVNQIPFVHQTL